MRALMVIAEMGSGGAEAVVHDLATHVLEGGGEVAVASDRGWRTAALARHGARLVPLPMRRRDPVSLARSVARLGSHLRRHRPEVVHAHNVRATLAASLAMGGQRVPVLTTVHGLAEDDYPRAAQVLARCSDLVVAVSDDVADRLGAGGLPADLVRVLDHASTPPRLVGRAEARVGLSLGDAAPVALCAARLVAPKRHDLLVDAWARLPADVHLLLAGDGPERPALERRIAEAGLRDRVRLLGDRDDVDRLLSASDAYLLASDREGLPVSVLEAMSAGVPVVASAVGGLASLDPAAVELVGEATVDAWADAVGRVLEDSARRAEMVTSALALVGRRFSPDAMAASYTRIYHDLTE